MSRLKYWYKEAERLYPLHNSRKELFIIKRGIRISMVKETGHYKLQDTRECDFYTDLKEWDYDILVKRGFIEGCDYVGYYRDLREIESITNQVEKYYSNIKRFKKLLRKDKRLNTKRIRNAYKNIDILSDQMFLHETQVTQFKNRYMGASKFEGGKALHLSIIQGSLRAKSTEDNPEAIEREYEDKNGNKKTKWEEVYSRVDGILSKVEFRKGDFGEQCILTFKDVDEVICVYMSTDSRYFTDFAKKLPNVDLSQVLEITPYDFEGNKGNQVRGMALTQNGNKIYSYYYDADKKKTINGLPQPDKNAKGEYDTDDWKMFFMKEKKFLKKKVEEVDFSSSAPLKVENVASSSDDSDDLPF